MTHNSSTECIYEGTKLFWRTRNNLDICIIEHCNLNILEVVLYEPSIDFEAERIYIDRKVLKTKLNNEDIEEKLSFAKRNNIPLTEQFIRSVINKSISDYLINRIRIDSFNMVEKNLEVSIQLTEVDLSAGSTETVLCSRPAALLPAFVKHHKVLMADVVQKAIEALQEDNKTLQESCATAAELSELNDHPLTIRERWRMPLVVAKVSRNERLIKGDRRIFHKIQVNMTAAAAETAAKRQLHSRRNSEGKHSPVPSVASTPRSNVTPRSTPMLHLNGVRHNSSATAITTSSRPSSSTGSRLCADTASSRLRNALEDTEQSPVSANKPRHPSKRGSHSSSRRNSRKSARTPRAKDSLARDSSCPSVHSPSAATACRCDEEGRVMVGAEQDHLCESNNSEEMSASASHIERLVAGLKSFGSSIKASFSVRRSIGAFDTIPESEERMENSVSLSAHARKEKIGKVPSLSFRSRSEQEDGIEVARKTSTSGSGIMCLAEHMAGTTALPTTAATGENSIGMVKQQQLKYAVPDNTLATEQSVTAEDTFPIEDKLRIKPVKRNSFFGSFLQVFTTTGTTTAGAALEPATATDNDNAAAPSSFFIPALSQLLRWGASNEPKVLPVTAG